MGELSKTEKPKFPRAKVKKRYALPSSGTTHEFMEIVNCPNCNLEYARKVSTGCFHHHVSPFTCPKCGYPYRQIRELEEKLGTNPSRRDSKSGKS